MFSNATFINCTFNIRVTDDALAAEPSLVTQEDFTLSEHPTPNRSSGTTRTPYILPAASWSFEPPSSPLARKHPHQATVESSPEQASYYSSPSKAGISTMQATTFAVVLPAPIDQRIVPASQELGCPTQGSVYFPSPTGIPSSEDYDDIDDILGISSIASGETFSDTEEDHPEAVGVSKASSWSKLPRRCRWFLASNQDFRKLVVESALALIRRQSPSVHSVDANVGDECVCALGADITTVTTHCICAEDRHAIRFSKGSVVKLAFAPESTFIEYLDQIVRGWHCSHLCHNRVTRRSGSANCINPAHLVFESASENASRNGCMFRALTGLAETLFCTRHTPPCRLDRVNRERATWVKDAIVKERYVGLP